MRHLIESLERRVLLCTEISHGPQEPHEVSSGLSAAGVSAAGGTFIPPPMPVTPTNPVQVVKAIVLNFEPTIPSENNRTLWEIFNWSDPRQLAAGYVADVESASGGAVDLQIVEWRDLNEFPIFTDGFRYNPDEYVANRRSGSGWHDPSVVADFYRIAEEHGLAELVNSGAVDEIWMFGDHFFNLLGEAWMAGPNSFFINGPSFPDFPVDRAVAGYGFSYERGVAEMLHNMGHRTENHGSRAYGGWNIANPATPWDRFTANVGQSNVAAFGVGSTHYPANAVGDYDYANPQTVTSTADDWVNYPNLTGAAGPVNRESWGGPDYHRNYQKWFFGHLPRNSGTTPDGRQNNWYKYIYDFNAYRPGTGLPRDNEAILGAPPLREAGASYEFTLRFYDTAAIDVSTLDHADVQVTGPGGFSQIATLVTAGTQKATTAGTARTVRYRVSGPGGAWDFADSGSYTLSLRANQVRDTQGNTLPAATLGAFRVELSDPNASAIDVNSQVAAGRASVTGTPSDIGGFAAMFDGNVTSLYRTPDIDPAVVTVAFDEPQTFRGFQTYFSHAGGNPAYHWKVETADSLADLDSASGSYRLAVGLTGAPSDQFSTVDLPSTITGRYARLTAMRLTGDNYVHINEWSLLGPAAADGTPPTATLSANSITKAGGLTHVFDVVFSDDRGVDATTLDTGDIRVTGPNGFSQLATFWGVDQHVNGTPRRATYFITAPGGAFDDGDNGLYTIELLAGEVRDTAGNAAAAATLGTLAVNIPAPQARPAADLTELNAADWAAWAASASASASDDTTRKTLGQASVKYVTNGGFDTYLRYAPPAGLRWDLTAATNLRFDVYAENPSPFGFQTPSPMIRIASSPTDYYEYRYYRDGGEFPVYNEARNAWRSHAVPLAAPTNTSNGWRRTVVGSPRLDRVTSLQFHADTWDFGFTLWYDRVGFNLPVRVTSSRFNFDHARQSLTLTFDQAVGPSLAADDLLLRHLGTNTLVPADKVQVAYDPQSRTATFTFPGYPNGVLPDGDYEATILASRVADAAGNGLAGDFTTGFFVLAADATRDRGVNLADYFAIDRGRAMRLTGFANGDLNYSGGPPDADDYLVIDRAFLLREQAAAGGAGMASAAPAVLPPLFGDRADDPGEAGVWEDPPTAVTA
jgi:hypothetical protein